MYKFNRSTRRYVLLGAFFTLMGVSSFAQEDNQPPEMITDRPDATESSSIVPRKTLQVETGGFYESFEDGDVTTKTYTYNTALLRYGLFDNVELRLGWDYVEQKTEINGTQVGRTLSGLSPLLAGAKIGISEEKGALPQMAIIGHVMLPFTAGEDFKPETTGVNFRFAFAHTLSDKSSLSYNVGAEWGDDSPEAAYIYTLAYGYSVTDTFGLYAELYGDFPENSPANHLWDAGLTYLVRHNVQLDATVGSSITDGQDILLSAGVSFRIPN